MAIANVPLVIAQCGKLLFFKSIFEAQGNTLQSNWVLVHFNSAIKFQKVCHFFSLDCPKNVLYYHTVHRHVQNNLSFSLHNLYCVHTDWFPGWSRKYGAEPSSRSPSEDCVELRQSFPGLSAVEPNDITSDDTTESKVVKNQLYWNDQECRQENWFVCSKRITNPNKREKFFVIT